MKKEYKENTINYVEQFSEIELSELLQVSDSFQNINQDNIPESIKLQLCLEMMYVTMRLCTQEKYKSFDDYTQYLDRVIDKIGTTGLNSLTKPEQLFLPAYAFCFRVLEDE